MAVRWGLVIADEHKAADFLFQYLTQNKSDVPVFHCIFPWAESWALSRIWNYAGSHCRFHPSAELQVHAVLVLGQIHESPPPSNLDQGYSIFICGHRLADIVVRISVRPSVRTSGRPSVHSF